MGLAGSESLLERIVKIFRVAAAPLTPSEIASGLSQPGYSVTTDQIESVLRGPLGSFVDVDSAGRYMLRAGLDVKGDPSRPSFALPQAVASTRDATPQVAPAIATKIQAQLEEWKKDLINFGKNNKLLYFNTSRRTRLRLTEPGVLELYEGIVLRDKSFSFAVPRGGNIDILELEDEVEEDAYYERRGDIAVDYAASSAKDVASLQRKLFRLRSDARSILNEQGINTLHLSIGVLEWEEAVTSEERVKSPLILIPVSLERERNGPYKLDTFEGDVAVNPTLVYRLRHDFAIELPSFDPYDGFGEAPDPLGYLEAVREVVSSRGWTVTEDSWLTHFSFEKLVMFEDLSQPGTVEAIAEHDVLSALTNVREIEGPEVSFEQALPAYERPDAYPVVDADSSQIEVLVRARSGSSMVVQGPPGTGKSQTIVNLIAQAIRDGRSVLFVSEKKAALDVVYRRLRDAGLADLCLELHSHKANKRQVVSDLFLALEASSDSREAARAQLFEQRRLLRERLDAYVNALHEPYGEGGRRAYEVHGELATLHDAPIVLASLPIESYVDLTQEQHHPFTQGLAGVARSGVWGHQDVHPWRDFVVLEPAFTAQLEIASPVSAADGALEALLGAKSAVKALFGLDLGPIDLHSVSQTAAVLRLVDLLPSRFPPAWLSTTVADFDAGFDLATRARDRVEQKALAIETLDSLGARELVAQPQAVRDLLPRYQDEYQSRFGRFSRMYRDDKRQVRAKCGKLRFEGVLRALEAARTSLDADAWLRSHAVSLESFVESSWPSTPSPAKALHTDLERVLTLRRSLPPNGLPSAAAESLLQDIDSAKTRAHDIKLTLEDAHQRADAAFHELTRWLPTGIDRQVPTGVPLETLATRAHGWRQSERMFDEWVSYANEVRHCDEMGLTDFLLACQAASVPANELTRTFERLVDTRWITEVYRSVPTLGRFAAKNHDATVEEFRRLDKALFEESREAVRHAASERQKEVRVAARYAVVGAGRAPENIRPTRDECKLVAKEYKKKTRHLPLRRLLPQLPSVLPAIKPCLLMSPLSVASYVPRGRFQFDIVIFDEASQVLPADAIGAIMRAKQLIVLGDSKQLPPTDFFKKRLDDADDNLDEDDDDETPSFASILEACSAVLPEESLRWHYRSRDERLIAFSNRTFYKDKPLITFPSPDVESTKTGVSFDYVSNGLYDRGGSRTNVEEARHVAARVIEHFDTYGWKRTLGVITLGIAQRDVIELELRRRLQDRPELSPFIAEQGSEPFFIKNLETVQGDERDDIILSLGFGPSQPGGLPALQFGPVSAKGGERRLNVAVTRAKYSLRLVSSMRPEQLDRAELVTNEGPRVMASYVRYAQRGGQFEDMAQVDPTREPESPFEIAVRDALIDLGYVVDCQVGVSHFRIDLAVRHPDAPSRYVLGIECDGAAYHRAFAARDRDRLRQEVLEEQGWHIYRLWSTDWIQNQERALQSLVRAIELARGQDETFVPREEVESNRSELTLVPNRPDIAEETDDLQHQSGVSPVLLPQPFIAEQRDALLSDLARLERQVRGLRNELTDIKGQPDRGYSGDVVEQALEQRLGQVRAALGAIDLGTYGTCHSCGRAIEIERLEAVPSTSLCRSCSLLEAASD